MTINFKYCEIIVTVIADETVINGISFVLGDFVFENIILSDNYILEVEKVNHSFIVKNNGVIDFATDSIDLLILSLYSAIVNIFVFNTKNTLFLHAGAVEKENRIIMFLGKSKSGKTSLTSYLSKEYHFNILSDEIIPINLEQEKIYVFPRVLSLRKSTIDLLNLNVSKGRCLKTVDNEKVLLIKRENFFCSPKDTIYKTSDIHKVYYVSFGNSLYVNKLKSNESLKNFFDNVCNFENLNTDNIKKTISFVERNPSYKIVMNSIENACHYIKREFYD